MMTTKQRNRVRLLATVLALALLAAACNGEAEDPAAEPGDEPAADVDERPDFLSIGTGGTGGAYYPIGGAMGSVLAREIEGVQNATAETTGGSVENINLIHQGQTELGLAQGDAVWQACRGEVDFDEPQDIRTIAMPYVNVLQVVTVADTGIQQFEDLAGARVSVGDAGSATEVFMRQVTETLGMTYDDFGETQRLPFADQTTAIRNRQLDVGSWVVAPGVSSIQDLAASEDIVVIEFSDEELAVIEEEHPYYLGWELEAGTYDGQDEAVPTPATWNSIVVHTDLADDFVYEITQVLHDNVDALASGHPSAGDLAPENIEHAVCPLHPGAAQYFEEVGVEIPDHAQPDAEIE